MDGRYIIMTKITFKMLANAKLKEYKPKVFDKYMIPEDEKETWKRPKLDSVANCGIVVFYELYKKRLLKRIYYFEQKWDNKQKVTNIVEIQREIAGLDVRAIRYIYQTMGNVAIKPTGYQQKWYTQSTLSLSVEKRAVDMYHHRNPYNKNFEIYYHNKNARDALLKKSMHKYSGFEYSGYSDREFFWYLAKYEKYPQLEMISKMGLGHIARDVRGISRKKQGFACLGIDKSDVALLKELSGISLGEFKRHRNEIIKYQVKNMSDYLIMKEMYGLETYVAPSIKLYNYIKNIEPKEKHYLKDYYRMAHDSGMLFTSNVKYPESIKLAHDDVMEEYIAKENAGKDAEIVKRVTEELYKYRFAENNYIITPANSAKDLIVESRELHHCVKSYIESYAEGRTSIFLIRDIRNVSQPLCTLELKQKKIVQCRADHNKKPSAEVISFLRDWCEEFKFETCFNL